MNGAVAQISTGEFHTCALTTDELIYCWGRNHSGELGDSEGGTYGDESPVPVRVSDANDFVNGQVAQVDAGSYSTCAVTNDGYAYCWGYNRFGNLGNNSRTSSNVPVKVVDNDGFVNGQIAQISTGGTAGYSHTCAVTTGGDLYCWGRNNHGQLGNNGVYLPDGDTGYCRCIVAPDLVSDADGFVNGSVAQVWGGNRHTCALGIDGYVYCWGRNDRGQLGNNNTTNSPVPVRVLDANGFVNGSVEQLSASGLGGRWHTCVLTNERTAYCWGGNQNGELGDGSYAWSLVPTIGG